MSTTYLFRNVTILLPNSQGVYNASAKGEAYRNRKAEEHLGEMYRDGIGTAVNKEKANYYLKKE